MFNLTPYLTLIATALTIVSVTIITIGALYSIANYVYGLLTHRKNVSIDTMRLQLGRSIILGVEFLLASDIIKTIITPDYYQIGLLGGLVIIRTVLTYFLDIELEKINQ